MSRDKAISLSVHMNTCEYVYCNLVNKISMDVKKKKDRSICEVFIFIYGDVMGRERRNFLTISRVLLCHADNCSSSLQL